MKAPPTPHTIELPLLVQSLLAHVLSHDAAPKVLQHAGGVIPAIARHLLADCLQRTT